MLQFFVAIRAMAAHADGALALLRGIPTCYAEVANVAGPPRQLVLLRTTYTPKQSWTRTICCTYCIPRLSLAITRIVVTMALYSHHETEAVAAECEHFQWQRALRTSAGGVVSTHVQPGNLHIHLHAILLRSGRTKI